MKKKSVPERLADLGKLYQSRNKTYDNDYMKFGVVMKAIFPNGLELHTAEEFNRYAIYMMAVAKLTRYANNFKNGGHADSLDDGSVYLQMLREFDDSLTL